MILLCVCGMKTKDSLSNPTTPVSASSELYKDAFLQSSLLVNYELTLTAPASQQGRLRPRFPRPRPGYRLLSSMHGVGVDRR